MKDIADALRFLADQVDQRSNPAIPPPRFDSVPVQPGPKPAPNPTIEMIDRMLGNVQPTPERDAALARWQEGYEAQVHAGEFPAANFIHGANEGAEAAFIYAASRIYRDKGKGDLYLTGLFSGTNGEINRLRNYGEQEQIYLHKSYADTVKDFPDTPVGQAVRAKLG